jgi:hypothetical protein
MRRQRASEERPRRAVDDRPHTEDPEGIDEPTPVRRNDGGIDTQHYIDRAGHLRARTQAAWLLRLWLRW